MKVARGPAGEAPKRGDLLETNRGDRRARTWFVLHAHRYPRINPLAVYSYAQWQEKPRFRVWRERWWELEPALRLALYRSAERRGGQTVWCQEEKPKTENLRRQKGRQGPRGRRTSANPSR